MLIFSKSLSLFLTLIIVHPPRILKFDYQFHFDTFDLVLPFAYN